MASRARAAFDESAQDVQRLMEIHRSLGGEARGRRYQLEVLNKSAVVLITAIWESYCEDIAAEALAHIVENAPNAGGVPTGLKKKVAKELEADPNEIAVWSLADSNWKEVLKKRLGILSEERNRRLNTPKAQNVIDLFRQAIGLEDISVGWRWPAMSVDKAKAKLDWYVQMRGAIAHRGHAAGSCTKGHVRNYFDFINLLVAKTGKEVNRYVRNATGKALW